MGLKQGFYHGVKGRSAEGHGATVASRLGPDLSHRGRRQIFSWRDVVIVLFGEAMRRIEPSVNGGPIRMCVSAGRS